MPKYLRLHDISNYAKLLLTDNKYAFFRSGDYYMIKIALCDDNSVQLNILEDLLSAYADESELDIDTVCFLSGEKLLTAVDGGYHADIYILDMIMPGIKGIELGKELRRRGDDGRIIYLTATAEYAVDSYQVGAFFYILKPISRQKINDVLNNAISSLTKDRADKFSGDSGDRHVELKTKEGRKSILVSELLYVDIINRSLAYHLADGSVLQSAMLRVPFADAVAELMNDSALFLAAPHLLINLGRIKKADKSSVTFANHETIFPSRGACEAILNQIQ